MSAKNIAPGCTVAGNRSVILGTEAYRENCAQAILQAQQRIIFLSAFVTSRGLEWVEKLIGQRQIDCRVVARWKPGDLVTGSSDLKAFEIAERNNWSFAISQTLHAKLFLIDAEAMFIGSANLTASGMSLVPASNDELGLCFVASPQDIEVVNRLCASAATIDRALYEKICAHIHKLSDTGKIEPDITDWPPEIETRLLPTVPHLWIADLPWTRPDELVSFDLASEKGSAILHDLRLLGLQDGQDADALCRAVARSKAYQWLKGFLVKEPDQQAYFGRITEVLFDSLLDDPRPYRSEIKQMLSNLIEYVAQCGAQEIIVDRPKHSVRCRLF